METATQQKLTKEEILDRANQEEWPDLEVVHRSHALAAMEEWAKVSGIHWFEIAKGELPPIDPDGRPQRYEWSKKVLVVKGEDVGFSKYSHATKDWLSTEKFTQPTHWAYINFPNP